MRSVYKHIILGGTFDRFHTGHELFVKTALKMGERITMGITTEPLYRHKPLSHIIEEYNIREMNVRNFILKIHPRSQYLKIIPITDVYGSSLSDLSIDAICVTQATKKVALLINKKRKQAGMKPLKVIVIPWVRGQDGQVISSERIRYGEIDRMGKNYYKVLTDTKRWTLPISLRSTLREPLGNVFTGRLSEKKSVVKRIVDTIQKAKPSMTFAIGDIIAGSLWESGFSPSITVIDYKSRREALREISNFKFQISNFRRYRNRAGTIEVSAVRRLKTLCNNFLRENTPQSLIIEGEEDLMVLPAILVAPLGSIVLYGQYNLGVIAVSVTEEKKEGVLKIVSRFNLL
ncbi:pantetheine-phosphate adenylyltransferase [Candidatus Roizmanbacteria bacterium]|nr:pantetheine-phosphate adenylyltransferase [Candidatus Roizmanbacteria bacterium]